MADIQHKIGQSVRTNEDREGIIRYVGKLHIASGDWLGLELPDASGKNDGSVKGERYFTCKPGHGIFVRDGAIVEILRQPVINAPVKTNGTATVSMGGSRARPSSGISADVARRRQSLMSNGPGPATGSRSSMMSPTKSPNVPTSASVSSTTSTPRTRTPAMVAKISEQEKTRPSVSSRPSMGPPSSTPRPSGHPARPSLGSSTSSSFRAGATARPAMPSTRSSATGMRSPQHARPTLKQEKSGARRPVLATSEEQAQSVHSPTIDEGGEDKENQGAANIDETLKQADTNQSLPMPLDPEIESPVAESSVTRVVSSSRVGNAGNVESRAAQQRETEQLKAKIRMLEKKRQEDRDKLKQVEALQTDKDRFEGIIQALQKKLRTNQQELVEVRSKYEEAESRANAVPERSGELESELELATLDREMAEERAETIQMELAALRAKHEELELEVDILREENAELVSTMSPEEKASAGWLQMERERERLRDALLKLRDMSQENESDLRAQVNELREQLDDAEKTSGMYIETAEKLTRAEETNKHLMGQLEAVESNDEVVEAMELQREQQSRSIEQLRNQIQDLEEHIQVTDELELFHMEEEKRLHVQLDDNEALLNESHRKITEQDRIVEDLEYTLTKFRDVVQGLQSDIDELRRSREISEMQANEMSSKSRAMMDLNLRLQNNAAKTQTKVIETELNKVKAELTSKHVDILSMFTPETFEPEKKPILAFLCFGRVRSKADLVGRLLSERLRERSHLTNGEEMFRTFETMEGMQWISGMCYRFEKYMQSCGTEDFAACGSALAELEPVERTVTQWIDVLRRDELAQNEPEHLKRMREILFDLSEKLIADSDEAKAAELVVQMSMVENYAESLTGQTSSIIRMVQSKLGPARSEDEESLMFDKRMDQLSTKSRTLKYLSGKVVQQLDRLYNSSVCPGERSWALFGEAEQTAQLLAGQMRAVGLTFAEELSRLDSEEPVSYRTIPAVVRSVLGQSSQANGDMGDDPFSYLSARLASLQSLVDDLQSRSSDTNNIIEFETKIAPWIVRAKEIKNTRFISPEVQDDLKRLERRNQELGTKIADRERTIEEMGMRVEIAEKRFKESKEKDNRDKALQEELDEMKSEKQRNEAAISALRAELSTAQQTIEAAQSELEALRSTAANGATLATTTADGLPPGTSPSSKPIDESLAAHLTLEAQLMQAELLSLQSAIRHLREENRSLRIPISETLINAAKHSWLATDLTSTNRKRRQAPDSAGLAHLERDGLDVWNGLIDVAKTVKPIRLRSTETPRLPTSHAGTTRYTILRQREELEKWEAWRTDFIHRARIATSGARAPRFKVPVCAVLPSLDGSNLVAGDGDGILGKDRGRVKSDAGGEYGVVHAERVRIVEP